MIKQPIEINPRLIPFIGLLGGQILAYLSGNGMRSQQELIQWIGRLGWPVAIVMMAIDFLNRNGLVRIEQGENIMIRKA